MADKISENAGIDVSPEKLMKEIKPLLDQLAEQNLTGLIKLFDDVVAEAKLKHPLAANAAIRDVSVGMVSHKEASVSNTPSNTTTPGVSRSVSRSVSGTPGNTGTASF